MHSFFQHSFSFAFDESTCAESAPKPEKLWNFFSFSFGVSSLLFRKLSEQIFSFWFILWLTSKFHLSGPLFGWSHFCMVWPATSRRHNPGNTWPQAEMDSQVLALELTWHLIIIFRDTAPVNHPYLFLPAENNSPSPSISSFVWLGIPGAQILPSWFLDFQHFAILRISTLLITFAKFVFKLSFFMKTRSQTIQITHILTDVWYYYKNSIRTSYQFYKNISQKKLNNWAE